MHAKGACGCVGVRDDVRVWAGGGGEGGAATLQIPTPFF